MPLYSGTGTGGHTSQVKLVAFKALRLSLGFHVDALEPWLWPWILIKRHMRGPVQCAKTSCKWAPLYWWFLPRGCRVLLVHRTFFWSCARFSPSERLTWLFWWMDPLYSYLNCLGLQDPPSTMPMEKPIFKVTDLGVRATQLFTLTFKVGSPGYFIADSEAVLINKGGLCAFL